MAQYRVWNTNIFIAQEIYRQYIQPTHEMIGSQKMQNPIQTKKTNYYFTSTD